MIVGLPCSLPFSSTSAIPARTAALCAAVGRVELAVAVSGAPVSSTPVTSARWQSALSRPKSCTPVDTDVAMFQTRGPPTESL